MPATVCHWCRVSPHDTSCRLGQVERELAALNDTHREIVGQLLDRVDVLSGKLDESRAEAEAQRGELERLRAGLEVIAAPDALLDANADAFNGHAAKRMQSIARAALAAQPAPTGDPE